MNSNRLQILPKLSEINEETNPVVDLRSLKNNMDYTFKTGKVRGEKTHFPPIDRVNNFTWKKGFLYCITGNPGSGKSEFINQLAILKAKNDGWKWGIYSPESYPVEDLIDTLIHAYVGKTTDPFYETQMSKVEYDQAFDFIEKHFTVFDFPDMPTVDDIKKAIKISKDLSGIIVDPFNSIHTAAGEMISEALKNSLTAFKHLAVKSQISLVLIEHPKSGNRIDEQSGQPKAPTEYDLYGGSMWHNKCDIIGVVHRPFIRDKGNTQVEFETLKIKNQKLHGYPDKCEFHFERVENRYSWVTESGRRTAFDTELTPMKDLFERAKQDPDYEGFDPEANF